MTYVMNDDFSHLWENIIPCDAKPKIRRTKNTESRAH